jgi:hypothetical protein
VLQFRFHLEALVHEILLPQSFENPPHGLHVVGVQSLIVVFEVDPATWDAGFKSSEIRVKGWGLRILGQRFRV